MSGMVPSINDIRRMGVLTVVLKKYLTTIPSISQVVTLDYQIIVQDGINVQDGKILKINKLAG